MRAYFYFYCALVFCVAVVVAGAPLPELKSFDLGNAGAAITAAVTNDGTYIVNGSGSVAYNGRDEARFTGLETEEPAFTFIARVAKVEGLTATSKYGLAIRASQWGSDKVVNWGYDARDDRRCLQWFARYSSRLKDDEGGQRCFTDGIVKQMKEQQGFWLKVTRRYPYVEMAFSMDGTQWTPVQYRAALLAKKVWVGMQVTAGGDGKQAVAISYDNVTYSVDKMPEETKNDSLHEYTQPMPAWKMYLAKVDGANGPYSAYIILPPDMAPAKIRAILFTPHNKELLLDSNVKVKFDSKDLLRKPSDMADYEGVYDIANLRPFYQG
ncbi:MAG: hypothetical protein WCJ56_16085, partial [bacterium]